VLPTLIGHESAQGLVLRFPFSILAYQDRLAVNTLQIRSLIYRLKVYTLSIVLPISCLTTPVPYYLIVLFRDALVSHRLPSVL
jgi:hypothetical protein